jgi:hypothetical protein
MVVGAIAALAGLLPPWWFVQRTGQTALSGNGFEGAGLLVFLAALALLFVVTLPFASRNGDSSLDRAPVYSFLAIVAMGSFLYRVYEILQFGGLSTTRSIGLWVTGVGLLIVAWGVGDVLTEKRAEY